RDRDPFVGCDRPRGRHHPGRHAHPPQRLPPAQAPARPTPTQNRRLCTMAPYTGPMTKKSRRLGVDLVGEDKAFEKRPYAPGQHGGTRIKESEYRNQLQEKQKARFTYGVMEKQFHNYYDEASRRPGKTGDNLLELLERRLDNVVYRAGFARTRPLDRQPVRA